MAESFVDTFKTEMIKDRVWQTRSQLELAAPGMRRLVQQPPATRITERPSTSRTRSRMDASKTAPGKNQIPLRPP
jgi:hypothetical protein